MVSGIGRLGKSGNCNFSRAQRRLEAQQFGGLECKGFVLISPGIHFLKKENFNDKWKWSMKFYLQNGSEKCRLKRTVTKSSQGTPPKTFSSSNIWRGRRAYSTTSLARR